MVLEVLRGLHKRYFQTLSSKIFGVLIGENQKGTAGRGREKKRHDHLRQTSRQFTTFYDNVRRHMPCTADRHMPGMNLTERLFYCICSHVGYNTEASRLRTCPGQSAHLYFGRFETCPGQRAHKHSCRSETCPGQCARKSYSRTESCSDQSAASLGSNCPGQRPEDMAQSRNYSAQIDDALEELKFWTMSIGCRNLRDCLREVPQNWKCLDVSQSDWWKEPGISERRRTLRELTTCEITHVVDTRCLRDTEGSASQHLGTNVINMRGMCHNANMKGLIKDIWTCIEDLLREAYKHVQPGKRVDVALGFVCNSGRHRSVCISEMTTAVLARMGLCADIDHLCQSDWKHLCGRDEAPCPACEFVTTELPWAPWFDWYYIEMMKCAQKRGCQHEDWWLHFCLPRH